ncbi:hypothetical protein [Arthrobacter sp. CAN_C5]|uniref:hypothetical protein n=1 Tax=Arthrobacter sp. CAN_C5 TaxID=2760706 RepID=UPI001AE9C397|nr:hypothetical protein [Arthrobacter sp. CAN_C5]MBP2218034.1 hypothetical protein [Arthrobacter sp. CAN_C5]
MPYPWLTPIGDLQAALVWEPWTPVIVGEQEDLDSMRRTRVRETVRALIEDIAQAEGTVHQDQVARLVGLAFGFSRLVSARARRIVGQIPRASVTVDADGFVWPEGVDRDTWLIHRTSSDAERPFEHISPVEIANAAASVVRDADNAVPSGELRTLVLQQFGRKRGSRTANAQLERGLAYATTSGRIS